MTPHKHYNITIADSTKPAEPFMNTVQRPCPAPLEAFLQDCYKIKAEDVAYMRIVPDFDVFKILLKDGTSFEVTGQLVQAYLSASGID